MLQLMQDLNTFYMTKNKASPSPDPWNNANSPADDIQTEVARTEKLMVLYLGEDSKGGIFLTIDKVAPYGGESVEIRK